MTQSLIRFNSIGSFHDMLQTVKERAQFYEKDLPIIIFRGTVKVNGTNRTVVFHGRDCDTHHFQSRDNIITVDNLDSYGFAAFAEQPEVLSKLRELALKAREFTGKLYSPVQIYGEWAGPGISGKINNAVEHLSEPHFFVFGIRISDDNMDRNYIRPQDIWTEQHPRVHGMHEFVLYQVVVDLADPQSALDQINEMTVTVEERCPVGVALVKHPQHVIGEGIVWRAHVEVHRDDKDTKGQDGRSIYNVNDMVFKTKGARHRKGKRTLDALITPEKIASIDDFISKVLEGRLEQGIQVLTERGLAIENQNIREYVKWLLEDIFREEAAMMIQAGLQESDVTKPIGQYALKFFREQMKRSKQ